MKTLIAVMLVSLMPGFTHAQGPAAQPAGAKIISIEGPVEKFGPCGPTNQPLAKDHILSNGCQLTATDPNTTVQIECTNGATLQPLTGGFVAVINGTGVPSCVLKLTSGSAMATSSGDANEQGSAAIETGALGAVVKHTSVVVTVPPSGAADAEVCVVDGEASVTRGGETISLTAGKMAYANSRTVSDIPDARLRWVANNLAVASTSGAGVQVSPAEQAQLSDRYLAVYKQPKNIAVRTELTRSLAAVAAPNNSFTRYQAAQATRLNAVAIDPSARTLRRVIGALGGPGQVARVEPGRFTNPTLNGRRVDICFHWGVECGKPAADAFCRAKDFSTAAEFTVATDIGAQTPTLVIGDNTVCSESSCDGFAFIRCQ